jgi:hypothetical protein
MMQFLAAPAFATQLDIYKILAQKILYKHQCCEAGAVTRCGSGSGYDNGIKHG